MAEKPDTPTGKPSGEQPRRGPFIPPLPLNQWTPETTEAMEPMRPPPHSVYAQRKADREKGGRRPANALSVLARHPALTRAFLTFNRHLLYESSLSERVRELVVLRISWLRSSEYEWAQHVPVALEVGLTQSDIDRIPEGPRASGWDSGDALVLRAVDETHHDSVWSEATWTQLSSAFDTAQLMDLLFTIGAYDTLAVAFNCFGLELDPELADSRLPPDPGGSR